MHAPTPRPLRRRSFAAPVLTAALAAMVAVSGIASSAWGDDDAEELKAWAVTVTIGREYDDSVSTDQTDTRSNQADQATVIEAGASYELFQSTESPVEVSYDYAKTEYDDLSAFDLESHSLFVATGRPVGDVDLGLLYGMSHTRLDDKAFLNLHTVTPTLGFAATDFWYVSTAYNYQNKMFHGTPTRDGRVDAASLDNFLFFNKAKSYVKLGYRIEREDTRSDEFDMIGHYLNAGLVTPVRTDTGAEFKLSLAYQFYIKDFTRDTASLGKERFDKRHTARATVTMPVHENADIDVNYKHIEATSNLASSDFTENVIGLSLGLKF